MTIYFDISAAVHRRAGLGRYAESLARELLPLLDDRLAFFYNHGAGDRAAGGAGGCAGAHGVAWLQAVADARLGRADGPHRLQPADAGR